MMVETSDGTINNTNTRNMDLQGMFKSLCVYVCVRGGGGGGCTDVYVCICNNYGNKYFSKLYFQMGYYIYMGSHTYGCTKQEIHACKQA